MSNTDIVVAFIDAWNRMDWDAVVDLDNFVLSGGRKLSVPVMGAFEIKDDRIRAWRDYFDLATFTRQMS